MTPSVRTASAVLCATLCLLAACSDPADRPLILTSSLPGGSVGSSYKATLAATGGRPPYSWSISSGRLPAGLKLTASTGVISGTPTAPGTASFTLKATDAAQLSSKRPGSIGVNAATAGRAQFGHVVIVVEENEDAASVIGSQSMPYLNSLISRYGLATQYYANTHPSIGNYMMLVTGQILTNDDKQTPASFPVSVDNVVRELLAHGKTWKAYAEDLPAVGYTGGDSGNYAVRHVPLAYLTDVQSDVSQRQNLLPFTRFATDLASEDLPNYAFVTPNLCNDAHNCSIATADIWLKKNIEPLLTSTPFKDDGLLIIVFDESGNDDNHGGGLIPAVLVSPAFSKPGFRSMTFYQHQSTLRLMLEGLAIESLPGAAATAAPMWPFFTFRAP